MDIDAQVMTPGKWQCGVRRLAVANGPNIFQMLLVSYTFTFEAVSNGTECVILLTGVCYRRFLIFHSRYDIFSRFGLPEISKSVYHTERFKICPSCL